MLNTSSSSLSKTSHGLESSGRAATYAVKKSRMIKSRHMLIEDDLVIGFVVGVKCYRQGGEGRKSGKEVRMDQASGPFIVKINWKAAIAMRK